jgi:AcrR family transcriptional regulator
VTDHDANRASAGSIGPLPRAQDASADGRTRRRLEARYRILEAADALFDENGGAGGGYERTTIDMIVERAGVSRRTYFNHFDTKADALLIDLKTMIARHHQALEARPPDEALFDAVTASFLQIAEAFMLEPMNRRRASRYAQLAEYRKHVAIAVGSWEEVIWMTGRDRLEATSHPPGPEALARARLDVGLALLLIRLGTQDWMRSRYRLDLGQCIGDRARAARSTLGPVRKPKRSTPP